MRKEDPERSQEKRFREIPLDMGRGNDAGHGGRGRTGVRGASGHGGCGRSASATVPCKASKQGACKDYEGHIFDIGSGNKGRDVVTYIGTKYGDNAAQEWTSEKRAILPKPAYSKAILNRHAERVKATKD